MTPRKKKPAAKVKRSEVETVAMAMLAGYEYHRQSPKDAIRYAVGNPDRLWKQDARAFLRALRVKP